MTVPTLGPTPKLHEKAKEWVSLREKLDDITFEVSSGVMVKLMDATREELLDGASVAESHGQWGERDAKFLIRLAKGTPALAKD
jgi:hypothetical protein